MATTQLSYIRCTQVAPGCLLCGPTSEAVVKTTFAADCRTLTLTYPEGDSFTYFPL